jgi:hypothetical protein
MIYSHQQIKKRDPSQFKPAGIEPPFVNYTVPDCLEQVLIICLFKIFFIKPDPGPPLTKERKFWTSDNPTGTKEIHWGIKDHEMPPPYHTYGIPSGEKNTTVLLIILS